MSLADLTSLSEQLHHRTISSVELTAQYLKRIEDLDPMLNSYITVCSEQAMASARHADEQLAVGRDCGVLHGIPIAVKDLIHTKGVRTTAGSRIRAEVVAQQDAFLWSRMLAAGAHLLGKTNLHEFAYGTTTENPHYGATHNPWDLTRSAGGSSGGSAAATAVDLTPASIGTDTGGSIRIPAACTGIVGFKPTFGLVSLTGVDPLAFSLDHAGPMGRSVRDVAVLLSVMAGPDAADPTSAGVLASQYGRQLGGSIRGLRVGIDEGCFFVGAADEVIDRVQAAVHVLEEAGAIAVCVSFPQVQQTPHLHDVIMAVEALSVHDADLALQPEAYGDDVRARLQAGRSYSAVDYARACRDRLVFRRDLLAVFQDIDVLVTPTLPFVAPPLGQVSYARDGQRLPNGLTRYTRPFNAAGFPSVSVPCGLSRAALPIGVQLVAKPFAEELLLQAAWVLEQAYPYQLPSLFA